MKLLLSMMVILAGCTINSKRIEQSPLSKIPHCKCETIPDGACWVANKETGLVIVWNGNVPDCWFKRVSYAMKRP